MAVSRFQAKQVEAPPRIIISTDTVDFVGKVDLDLAMQMLFSAQLRILQTAVEKAPDDLKEQLRGYFYDIYNQEASGVLSLFAPDIEMRPDLTAEAIMEAENQIMTKRTKRTKSTAGEAEMSLRQLEISALPEAEPFG